MHTASKPDTTLCDIPDDAASGNFTATKLDSSDFGGTAADPSGDADVAAGEDGNKALLEATAVDGGNGGLPDIAPCDATDETGGRVLWPLVAREYTL